MSAYRGRCACATAACVIGNFWTCSTIGCRNGPTKPKPQPLSGYISQYADPAKVLPRVGQSVRYVSWVGQIVTARVLDVDHAAGKIQIALPSGNYWVDVDRFDYDIVDPP
jgi:hypothetical protein